MKKFNKSRIISLLSVFILVSACHTYTQSSAPTLNAQTYAAPTATMVPSPTPNPPSVTYIDNSSFIVSAGLNKILFDPHYLMPKELKEPIMAGQEPFADLDMVLITHDHSDHFDVELTLQLLRDNPGAALISTQSVIDQVSAQAEGESEILERLFAYEPEAGQRIAGQKNGISFEVLNLPHNYPVSNLGFLVDLGGLMVFNTGDIVTLDALDNYDLQLEEIDLAFIPYFYLIEDQYWNSAGDNVVIQDVAP
jgi:L-ascorbate metabolism protein UlaG (beta-lactamase superfamily)